MSKAADILNKAWQIDPEAMYSLVENRVPCTRALLGIPGMILVESAVLTSKSVRDPVYDWNYRVGMLGVINMILKEFGEPEICMLKGTNGEVSYGCAFMDCEEAEKFNKRDTSDVKGEGNDIS